MRLNTLFYIAEPLKILSDNFDKTKINDKSIGVLVGNVVFRPQAITLAGIKDHGMMKDLFANMVQEYDRYKSEIKPF